LTDSHASGEELVDPRWALAPATGERAGHAWSIAQTLGGELERVRLAHRAHRVEQVLAALGERRRERARTGTVPPALSHAIDDFSHELARMRVLLSATPQTTRKPAAPMPIVRAASTKIV
jgi:hypothetical protein